MLTDIQIISQFINESRLMLIESQLTKGLRASGESAKSLGVTVAPLFGQLIDRAGYFYFQENGRKAGKAPSFKKIYDWLEYEKYGLKWNYTTTYSRPVKHVSKEDIGLGLDSHKFEEVSISPEENRKRLAWAIINKIKLKGTYTHQRGPTNVVSDVFARDRITALSQAFASKYQAQAKSDIVTEFKPKN